MSDARNSVHSGGRARLDHLLDERPGHRRGVVRVLQRGGHRVVQRLRRQSGSEVTRGGQADERLRVASVARCRRGSGTNNGEYDTARWRRATARRRDRSGEGHGLSGGELTWCDGAGYRNRRRLLRNCLRHGSGTRRVVRVARVRGTHRVGAVLRQKARRDVTVRSVSTERNRVTRRVACHRAATGSGDRERHRARWCTGCRALRRNGRSETDRLPRHGRIARRDHTGRR